MSKLSVFVLVVITLLSVSCARTRATPAPRECGVNEVYLQQGTAPNCDTVCMELGKPCTIRFIWAPFGCYCKPKYARDDNNVCIPISQCVK